ncbi:class I SAM-dependent DNA methyltransferase [Campylobacter sp. MIT 21-1685]|uniref:type IIG restriction enzyme/methyltransferase n=1 Tax=unclassified Campylobacter TaxID=2593542 RepID=UPI00224A53E7|nr:MULTISPECIES: DNA methyltransferase [unclassified Campylobacter]MCX2683414.1 class I SAM-dependent DNA methyltransferase [Campylobacter sp. MIT 21-1684]MCX2807860.1 class I SAM-dependent DNA methyltransferase [Campylobacter sp. MIT 21-1685]
MSHILLWLNRILFLKLIEANLLAFNEFDKALNFLSGAKIKSFKDLSHLFFEVLAKDYESRTNDRGFNFLPYLNSSLFIKDEKLEILDIALLDDTLEIEVFQSTQSTHKAGSKCAFLVYLFDFLNAFDFGKKSDSCHLEGEARNISLQTPSEESYNNKELIQSSVLGAVFEKLNGYKEGSFYTPSFITSYMCRESLSKIVVEKFNAYNPAWNAKTLEDIEEEIHREKRKRTESSTHIKDKYKKLLQSIRICDPSVGSGHFLVSALSEMVNIYYKLGLLEIDCESLEIKDDEIYLKIDKENFAYKRPQSEQNKNHQIQKSLFELKKSIIENNLFGVDINPNSCNIARLRLWIELLKNAYYLNFTKDKDSKTHKLQTLPNIDINIKCGNSLVSRFNLNDSLKIIPNIKEQIKKYKQLVFDYKNADQNVLKISKKDIESQIEIIKQTFTLTLKDPKTKRELEKAVESHIKQFNDYLLDNASLLEGLGSLQFNVFGTPALSEEEQERALQSYGKIQALRKKLDLALSGAEYKDAFEWRFAFPEVLDSNGDFLGFDLVIGNPPYGVDLSKNERELYKKTYNTSQTNTAALFIFLSDRILAPKGINTLIVPKSLNYVAKWEQLRDFIAPSMYLLADCGKAWDYVLLEMVIFARTKGQEYTSYENLLLQDNANAQDSKANISQSLTIDKSLIKLFGLFINGMSEEELNLGIKLNQNNEKLEKYCKNIRGASSQSNLKENGTYAYIGGKQINRFRIVDIKGFSDTIESGGEILDNALLAQDIVAHITKPKNHIKIIACIPNNKDFLVLNTINQLVFGKLNLKLAWAIINSKLINWYVYKFIFSNSIRTMHLNSYATDKIPIPKITKTNQKIANKIIALVDRILTLKAENKDSNSLELENEIDKLVYKLYNLTDEEIYIIEK